MRGPKTFTIGLLLTATLLAAVPTAALAASNSEQMRRKLFSLTNLSRRNNSMRALDLNYRLSKDALQHSRRMAERHTVYHSSNLYRLVKRWRPSTWGENVGMAGTVQRVHRAFMNSSAHRSNILRTGYSKVGIGVFRGGGRIWATVIFYGG